MIQLFLPTRRVVRVAVSSFQSRYFLGKFEFIQNLVEFLLFPLIVRLNCGTIVASKFYKNIDFNREGITGLIRFKFGNVDS